MRKNVRAWSFVLRTCAITSASKSCGTVERNQIPNVFSTAFQKYESWMQERVVVEPDEVGDRVEQVPVGERDVRGVAEREEPEDTEDEEERGDEEVRRELRVQPAQKLAARAGRGDDLACTSCSGYRAHGLLVIVSGRAAGVEGAAHGPARLREGYSA